MLSLLAQDSTQEMDMTSVLIWPVLLTFLGIGIFFLGLYLERKQIKSPWKWIAVVPELIGIYIGYGYAASYGDEFYRSAHVAFGAKKLMASHYGALILPVLGLASIILLHFFNHRIKLVPED